MKIGDKIYELRKKGGISQEELSDRLNVSRQSVSLWETNQTLPAIDNLISIAEIFHISLDELCGKENQRNLPEDAGHEPKCMYTTETVYTPVLYKRMLALSYQKYFTRLLVAMFSFLALGTIFVFLPETTNVISGRDMGIFLIIVSAILALIFLLQKYRIAKQVQFFMKAERDVSVKIFFYHDFFKVVAKGEKTSSESDIRYADLNLVVQKQDFIYLSCAQRVLCFAMPRTEEELQLLKSKLIAAKTYKCPTNLATALTILFVASIFSMFLGLAFVSIFMDIELEDFISKVWGMYIALPLPLSCLILGLVAKKRGLKSRKNIIAGAVFSIFLLLFGSFPFIMRDTYAQEYSLVYRIEDTIHFELSHTGEIFTNIYRMQQTMGEKIDTDSRVRFTASAEIASLKQRISDSALWTTFVAATNQGLVPLMHKYKTYDYYLIYCIDLNLYNEVPTQAGEYDFIFLGFNTKTNILAMVEYSFRF